VLSRDLRERGEQTLPNYGLDANQLHHNEMMMKSSDGMRFTLGKDDLPTSQPLRSDGFHYTHQQRDHDFEKNFKGILSSAPSEGAFREEHNTPGNTDSLINSIKRNLEESKQGLTTHYALRVRNRF
jgi:hypothetical protein